MTSRSFRSDIQGIRALAVLSVVVFHISPQHLPGGFIGVDMFFVISGYLIMGHIWAGLQDNSFSFLDFYTRRLKRLFPALMATVAVTSVFAWVVFLPGEFLAYSRSVIYSLLYASNFWFYSKSGYFDSELQSAPLLHTWSLSVEEQFYIVAPLALYFLYKKRFRISNTLLVIFVASLLLSEVLLYVDESLSFYASPSRFWQFIAGGILSIHWSQCHLAKWLREVACLASLAILAACMLFMSETDFPGLNAVLPTLATAVLIYACQPSGLSYNLLSNPFAKHIGDISYSLYLWHWPVIIFYKALVTTSLFMEDKVVLLILSILFGFLSYRFIETPFRNIQLRNGSFRPLAVSLGTTFGVIAVAVYLPQVKYQQFSAEQIEYEKYLDYPADEYRKDTCFITSRSNDFRFYDQEECVAAKSDKRNILLVGDSHAAHWYGALSESLGEGQTLTQATASGCKPVLQATGERRCTELINWSFSSLLNQHKFDKVVLSARWEEGDVENIKKTIAHLSQLTNEVVVLGPVLEYQTALPRVLVKHSDDQVISQYSLYDQINRTDEALLKGLSASNARYISVLDAICSEENVCTTVVHDVPLQFDYGHLTFGGAKHLLSKMEI